MPQIIKADTSGFFWGETMMQEHFSVEATATPEFITEQIGHYFFPTRWVVVPDGKWYGFGVVARKTESRVVNPKTILGVLGRPFGLNDPTLDGLAPDWQDVEQVSPEELWKQLCETGKPHQYRQGVEQVSPVDFMGNAVRCAAEIIITPNRERACVQFIIHDADLRPMFNDLARIIAPTVSAQPTADQTPTTQPPAPTDAPKTQRFFGFRINYVVVAFVLAILIIVVSILLFPDWTRSIPSLAILCSIAFATSIGITAGLRKILE